MADDTASIADADKEAALAKCLDKTGEAEKEKT